jgi:amino acid adenylation domain-containing protein
MGYISDNLVKGFLEFSELPALEVGDECFTYQDLYDESAQLAGFFRENLDKIKRVGILAYRNKYTYTGILACVFSGVTFVPLNKNFPLERTLKMVKLAELDIIIGDKSSSPFLDLLLQQLIKKPLVVLMDSDAHITIGGIKTISKYELELSGKNIDTSIISANDIVYLLFTSGSTGIPKGVPISYDNLSYFIKLNQKRYKICTSDRFSQTFDHTFDLSMFDMFMAWCHGACLVAMQPIDLLSPSYFVQKNNITVWFSVPSLIGLARRKNILKPNSMPSLRISLFCGEALSVKDLEVWYQAAPQSKIENLYGPTELTIACAAYHWDPVNSVNECRNGIVPIGKVYEGHYAKILDDKNEETSEGELCITGPQMFKKYWKNEEKTNDAFVQKGEYYFYRTGDRVKLSPQGNLLYLGRLDHQIKVNGYRIELGDIESCIRNFSDSVEAIAIGWPELEGKYTGIVVFVTGISEKDKEEIMEFTRLHLPQYMCPDFIKVLDSMPLNANGKGDRKYLKSLLDTNLMEKEIA